MKKLVCASELAGALRELALAIKAQERNRSGHADRIRRSSPRAARKIVALLTEDNGTVRIRQQRRRG